jgi:hypothetical protein
VEVEQAEQSFFGWQNGQNGGDRKGLEEDCSRIGLSLLQQKLEYPTLFLCHLTV